MNNPKQINRAYYRKEKIYTQKGFERLMKRREEAKIDMMLIVAGYHEYVRTSAGSFLAYLNDDNHPYKLAVKRAEKKYDRLTKEVDKRRFPPSYYIDNVLQNNNYLGNQP
jgi:hypothetical protein